jgi:hypothetical protein
MSVNVALPLFGTPGQELEEGSAAQAKRLRAFAAELNGRLERAAETLDKMAAAGWTARVAVHDLMFAHPDVQTEPDARRRIKELGLDPEAFVIIEDLPEDEIA